MKRLVIVLSLVATASLAVADEEATLAKGKELFLNAQLGTNGKSCNHCHAGGKGLEKTSQYEDGNLGATVNQCIVNSLNGEALDPSSSDLKSLVIFVKSLSTDGLY